MPVWLLLCLALLSSAPAGEQDYAIACSAGCLDGTPVVDLNYAETGSQSPELIIAILPKTDRIVYIQVRAKRGNDLTGALVSGDPRTDHPW